MRARIAWWVFMLAAVPALVLVGMSVASQLPYVLAEADHQDREGVMAWAGLIGLGAVLLIASVAARASGRISLAIGLAAVVALPALAGLGLFLLIVAMFIAKG